MEEEFVWVFKKPGEHDVVQLPEAPVRDQKEEVWWNLMVLLLHIFTGSIT